MVDGPKYRNALRRTFLARMEGHRLGQQAHHGFKVLQQKTERREKHKGWLLAKGSI